MEERASQLEAGLTAVRVRRRSLDRTVNSNSKVSSVFIANADEKRSASHLGLSGKVHTQQPFGFHCYRVSFQL